MLITTKQSYDLIFSEPSNPYRAGIASLFTTEFYQTARARLNPNGLFLQWVQAYELNDELLATAKPVVARTSPEVATAHGLRDAVTIGFGDGMLTLPLQVVPGMAPDTVWVPQHAVGGALSDLGLVHGDPVTVSDPVEAVTAGGVA